jgi:hypothetical protein
MSVSAPDGYPRVCKPGTAAAAPVLTCRRSPTAHRPPSRVVAPGAASSSAGAAGFASVASLASIAGRVGTAGRAEAQAP